MTLKLLDFDSLESWTVWESIPPRDAFKIRLGEGEKGSMLNLIESSTESSSDISFVLQKKNNRLLKMTFQGMGLE
jgi:hypothetical protein